MDLVVRHACAMPGAQRLPCASAGAPRFLAVADHVISTRMRHAQYFHVVWVMTNQCDLMVLQLKAHFPLVDKQPVVSNNRIRPTEAMSVLSVSSHHAGITAHFRSFIPYHPRFPSPCNKCKACPSQHALTALQCSIVLSSMQCIHRWRLRSSWLTS